MAQLFTSTPTPEMRQGIFTFPGVTPIRSTIRPLPRRNADGTWTRDPFPGNPIPLNRFDPVARKVLEYDPWVLPNQAGTFTNTGPSNNLLADEFARVFFNDYNLRIDHQFSPTFKLYGSYTQNDQSGFGRPKLIKEDLPGVRRRRRGTTVPTRQLNTSIGYTWVSNAEDRQRFARRLLPPPQRHVRFRRMGGDWPAKLGIPNVDQALMPSFGIYNITGATPSKTVNETLSFRNDTTWIRGSHAFKFGYEILRYRLELRKLRPVRQLRFRRRDRGSAAERRAPAEHRHYVCRLPDRLRAAGDIQCGADELAAAVDHSQLLYSGRLEDHATADRQPGISATRTRVPSVPSMA